MLRNSSNQSICAQLVNSVNGAPVTSGATTVYVIGDNGVQTLGSGVVAHKGQGVWSYVPTQSETNYAHVVFTFLNPAAINTTVQVFTVPEGQGSGPYLLTINVRDSVTNLPIQNAAITLTRSGEFRYGITDVNGQIVVNSSAVTWTAIAIVANGYTFGVIPPIAVTGNMTVNISGTLQPASVPALASQVNARANTYNEYGQLEHGVKIYVQMALAAENSGIYDSKIAEFTSVNGIVTITNLFKTAKYDFWRGKSPKITYKIPDTSDLEIQLPPFIGDDSTDPCLT